MRWMIVLMLALVTLSGCSDEPEATDPVTGDDPETTTTTTTGTTAPAGGGEATTAPGENGTLSINLSADPTTGVEPTQANVTLNITSMTADGGPGDASVSWNLSLSYENGTSMLLAENESLPYTLALELAAGNHTLQAAAQAEGYGNATASVAFTIEAFVAPEPAGPIFFEDFEDEGSRWTISSNVYFYDVFTDTEEDLSDVPHPDSWAFDGAKGVSGGSMASGFPGNYRTYLTSPTIEVPEGGATFTYWYTGGAEDNGVDGLHVLIDGAEVAYYSNDDPDWTQGSFLLAAGSHTLTFRFDADPACDAATNLPGLCGAGNYVGYWVDDVMVA